MNISLTVFGFALALLIPGLVEAEGGDGRIAFSGAVVEPTCQNTSQPVASSSGPNATSGPGQCVVGPASVHPQVVMYDASTRVLRTDEPDRLLRYLVERSGASGTEAPARLRTVTYL